MAVLTASFFVLLSACVFIMQEPNSTHIFKGQNKNLEQKLKCREGAVVILDPHQKYKAGHFLDQLLLLNQEDHIGGMHRR